MLRFLPGVLLLQLATLVLLWLNLSSWRDLPLIPETALLLTVLLPCALLGLLTAFWFSAVARQANERALGKLREAHARERQKIEVRAERDKTRLVEKTQKEIKKETRRVNTKANMKVGLSLMGVAVAGVVMIITELITLGMMTLTTAGGALGGYLFRGKPVRQPSAKLAESVESAAPKIPRVVGEGRVVAEQVTPPAASVPVSESDDDPLALPTDQDSGRGTSVS